MATPIMVLKKAASTTRLLAIVPSGYLPTQRNAAWNKVSCIPNRTARPSSNMISLASGPLMACMFSHAPNGSNQTVAISNSPSRLVMTVVSTQTL